MAKWWKFGLGKKKDTAPSEGPATPAPAPKPTPEPTPEPPAPKKRGLLGRIFGRKKGGGEAPAEGTGPAPAPASEPSPAPAGEPGPEAGEEGEGGEATPPPRVYPSVLHVAAEGDWVISDTEWTGTMSGTLTGADVKRFIDAMEAEGGPNLHIAIPLIADAYGIPGGLIDVSLSTVRSVNY
ncbi:hypothetical protein ABZ697_31105 [Streptomyces albidoflavus]|uniref:hypothetical protein n=1 Tax=Streptomyces albidoflavus TaxID=1886 RepID=UPI0033D0EC50